MAVALGLALLVGLIATGLLTLSRRPTDPLFLFFVVFAMFYGLRAVLVGTGLDSLNPDYLFVTSDESALVATALFHLDAFLVCFIVAAWALTRRAPTVGGLMFMPRRPARKAMDLTVGVLTALTLLTTASLVIRYHGVSEFMAAAKLEKALSGQYVLKLPAVLGAFLSAAAVIDAARDRIRRSPRRVVILGSCALFNAVCVFAWGQRSVVVVVIAMVVLGTLARSEGRSSAWSGRTLARVVVAAVLVVTASFSLRVIRDVSIHDEGGGTGFASSTAWRQLSLSVNGVYFDASVLAFRDWPTIYSFRDSQDFTKGVLGTIPRAIYPDKPEPLVGKAFRQVYEPEITNGWPVGAPTIWYLAYGFPGVLVGGLLSGGAIGYVSRRSWAVPATGLNVGLSVVMTVYVLQLGVSSETPFRAVLWLGPLLPVVWALRSSGHEASEQQGSSFLDSVSRPPATPGPHGGSEA